MNLVQDASGSSIPRESSAPVRRGPPPVWTPLALLLGLSVLVRFLDVDQSWQRRFWSPESGWLLKNHPVVQSLYQFGTWPALAIGGGSALIWIGSWVTGRWRSVRSLSLFLSLLLVIGPGLVVNAIFKAHFGRARPAQTREFGGKHPFQPLGQPGAANGGKSFPCGHGSMGFYWLGLFIYFWERRRGLAWAFCALGLVHGGIMGFGRMAQGGHWPSDALWSAGFVYLTAWLLHRILPRFCSKKAQ